MIVSTVCSLTYSLSAFGAEELFDLTELKGRYLEDTGMYEYYFPEGGSFLSSVPDGGVTDGMVWLEFPEEMECLLMTEEGAAAYESGRYLLAAGDYTAYVSHLSGRTGRLRFRIVSAGSAAAGTAGPELSHVELTARYDTKRHMYVQELPSGQRFLASIPDGMITDRAVALQLDPEDVYYTLTRDGELLSYRTGEILTEPGYYHLNLLIFPDLAAGEQMDSRFEDVEGALAAPSAEGGLAGALTGEELAELERYEQALDSGAMTEEEIWRRIESGEGAAAGAHGQSAAGAAGQSASGAAGQSASGAPGQSASGAAGTSAAGAAGTLAAGAAGQPGQSAAEPPDAAVPLAVFTADFRFFITGESTNFLDIVNAPEGYRIGRAQKNGQPFAPDSPFCHFLETDGVYRFLWVSLPGRNLPSCESRIALDTLPPELYVRDMDRKGNVSGEAVLTVPERGTKLQVLRNGEPEESLSRSGRYRITAADGAGNENTLLVRVKPDPHLPQVLFAALFLLVTAGVYSYRGGKRFKVR